MTILTVATTVVLSLSAGAMSTPRITGIGPQTLAPSANVQSVTVTGQGFMRGLSLTVTNPDGATDVFKDVEVQAQEEASFRVSVRMQVAGAYSFVVTNTDGGVSQPFKFTLRAATPTATPSTTAPIIDAITPSKGTKQSQPQSLRIEGKRFQQGLVVTVNDAAGNATQVSGNAISDFTQNGFTISVLLTVEGEYTVSLVNPDGQASNAVSLSVRAG
jgi:hypothetical protein